MASLSTTNSNSLQASPLQVQGVRIPTYLFASNTQLARHAANQIADLIRANNAAAKPTVLGLPTGSTPVGVYRELIRLHREEELDFSQVITFNLVEYFGLGADKLQSFHRWMHEHFFDHVNIPAEHIHIPNGLVPLEEMEAYCAEYEAQIVAAGGIDLMLLGIGRNGHVGFNEPFSIPKSRTRLCTLDPVTRRAAASDFFGDENVPLLAITMGLGTILEARQILAVALGEHKAQIVLETLEAEPTDRVPASILQSHHNVSFLLDQAAGQKLTDVAMPWRAGNVTWTDALIKRAVLWLCEQSGKALLKLSDHDFREHNLHQLLRHHGPAQRVAHKVFRWMMDTIEYHPAGKEPKKVICFSPHPDDDVISMGGTLIRLVEDGHEAHVAYMTSGNIAVFDHDASRVADFVTEYNRTFGIDVKRSQEVEAQVVESFHTKAPGASDIEVVRQIKGLIRWSEAKAGAVQVGCREQHLHYLDLPFYRTGLVRKNPVGAEDVRIIRELIESVSPDQIYVAGDLSDPHGTHRVCAEAIFQALAEIESAGGTLPEVLLYRGAWQEYALHEIEIAVPLSPNDVLLKRKAIFMHESQKDEALFPGSDPREFWQRAEDRNKGTADAYNRMGLPEYFALEGFVRWDGVPI